MTKKGILMSSKCWCFLDLGLVEGGLGLKQLLFVACVWLSIIEQFDFSMVFGFLNPSSILTHNLFAPPLCFID